MDFLLMSDDRVVPPSCVSYEPCGILASSPQGKPEIVAPKPDFDWSRVLADVKHVMPRHEANEQRLAEWDAFVDQRPKNLAEAARVDTLPKWNFACIPRDENSLDDHRAAAARAALRDLAIVQQPATIASNAVAGSGAEGNAERRARTTWDAEHSTLALTPDGFVFVKMNYTTPVDAGGCRIPACLVQLPSSFGELDTRDPKTVLSVKWWEPKPPDGKYDGEWRKWTNGGRRQQYVTEVTREEICMIDVQFTRRGPLANGNRKLNKATKDRLMSDAFFKYSEYSASS